MEEILKEHKRDPKQPKSLMTLLPELKEHELLAITCRPRTRDLCGHVTCYEEAKEKYHYAITYMRNTHGRSETYTVCYFMGKHLLERLQLDAKEKYQKEIKKIPHV